MAISKPAPLLQVDRLNAGYGKRQVLFDLSLDISKGELVLLTGANGCGKSTLLKAIFGLAGKYPGGRLLFDGNDITAAHPGSLLKKGLAYVPQKNNSFQRLNVLENLKVVLGHLKNAKLIKGRIASVFAKMPQLAALQNRLPLQLSGGEKQQLALALAIAQQPKMILLDEPGAGLSPHAWGENFGLISRMNREGTTFLLVEHRVTENLPPSARTIQMGQGEIVTYPPTNNKYE